MNKENVPDINRVFRHERSGLKVITHKAGTSVKRNTKKSGRKSSPRCAFSPWNKADSMKSPPIYSKQQQISNPKTLSGHVRESFPVQCLNMEDGLLEDGLSSEEHTNETETWDTCARQDKEMLSVALTPETSESLSFSPCTENNILSEFSVVYGQAQVRQSKRSKAQERGKQTPKRKLVQLSNENCHKFLKVDGTGSKIWNSKSSTKEKTSTLHEQKKFGPPPTKIYKDHYPCPEEEHSGYISRIEPICDFKYSESSKVMKTHHHHHHHPTQTSPMSSVRSNNELSPPQSHGYSNQIQGSTSPEGPWAKMYRRSLKGKVVQDRYIDKVFNKYTKLLRKKSLVKARKRKHKIYEVL